VVVRHHHHGRRIKAVEQHAAFVVRGGVHRAAHKLGAAIENPGASLPQQRTRDLSVVDTLEEAEKARFLAMEPVMVPVDDGGDAADHLARPPRQEELSLRVGVKRMLLAIQQLLDRDSQRRHPVGIISIEPEWKFHKLIQISLAVDRYNFNASQ